MVQVRHMGKLLVTAWWGTLSYVSHFFLQQRISYRLRCCLNILAPDSISRHLSQFWLFLQLLLSYKPQHIPVVQQYHLLCHQTLNFILINYPFFLFPERMVVEPATKTMIEKGRHTFFLSSLAIGKSSCNGLTYPQNCGYPSIPRKGAAPDEPCQEDFSPHSLTPVSLPCDGTTRVAVAWEKLCLKCSPKSW